MGELDYWKIHNSKVERKFETTSLWDIKNKVDGMQCHHAENPCTFRE